MGFKRRLNRLWVIAGVLSLTGVACSKDDDADQRRQLLSARERTQARKERGNAQRIRSPTGDLLPSTVVRSGIVLPRGLKQRIEEKYSWTYDAQFPPDKVVAYFDQRLAAEDTRRGEFEVEYRGAREKSDSNNVGTVVRVEGVPSKGESYTRVVVLHTPPPLKEPKPLPPDLLQRAAQQMRNRH